MNWTPNQRKAIEYRGGNLLVSAAAGSGKTTVMIERVVSLIQEGQSLNHMAICTFTNASAADMRLKLTNRLTQLEGELPSAAKELRILPQADISTLHKWCSKIIKTYFYASDLDASFEILDETEAAAMLEDCVERVIEEEILSEDESFLRLYDILKSNRKHRVLKETLVHIFHYAEVMPQPEKWLEECKTYLSHRQAVTGIREHYAEKLQRLQKRIQATVVDVYAAKFESEYAFADSILAAAQMCGNDMLETPRVKKDSEFADLHTKLKEFKAEVKELLKKYDDASTFADAAITFEYLDVLIRMCKRISILYSKDKRYQSYADYNDLEHQTLKILKSGKADELRQKYRYVFVDEYQDINPLQEEILKHFDGNMFFVGDVKQSIYGFRMCDPAFFVYKQKNYKAEKGGVALELNANFRSDNGILSFVNDVFKRCMTEEFGKVDYKNDAAFEKGNDLYSPSVVATLILDDEKEVDDEQPDYDGVYGVQIHNEPVKDSVTEAEVNLTIEHILHLINQNITENGEVRPVCFEDIAVLVRGRSAYSELLLKKMEKAQIPVYFADSQNVLDRQSISALISYLRCVDNAEDDISLAAVMLSYFGGFSNDDLAQIRLRHRQDFFYQSVQMVSQEEDALALKVRNFLQQLQSFTTLSAAVTVGELAGAITAHYGYFKKVLADFGEDEATILALYLDSLTDNKLAVTLYAYLSSLADKLKIEPPEKSKAVRIMTIHASKGLEFPFVILPNLHKKYNTNFLKQSILLSEGICMRHYSWQDRTVGDTALFSYEKLRQAQRTREEEMRVLYVALTRAKYQLALIGKASKQEQVVDAQDANSYLQLLYPVLKNVKKVTVAQCEAEFSEAPQKNILFKRADQALAQKIHERIAFLDNTVHVPLKSNVTKLIEQEDLEESFSYVGGGESDDRALEKGNAYHKAMELMDFTAPFDSEWAKLCSLPNADLLQREHLQKAHEIFAKLTKDCCVYKERSFILVGENAQLIQGIIDLLIVDGDGQGTIIDYKTGNGNLESNLKYRAQLDYYQKAVEEILHISVAKRYLYSVMHHKLILA